MTQSRFAKLVDLARTPDSEVRRELLREVTDLFFETSGSRNTRESALFDEVLQMVAAEMQDSVLVELSEAFANADDAPVGLMRDLANHSFEIAGPVLRIVEFSTSRHCCRSSTTKAKTTSRPSHNAKTSARPSPTRSSSSATTTRSMRCFATKPRWFRAPAWRPPSTALAAIACCMNRWSAVGTFHSTF